MIRATFFLCAALAVTNILGQTANLAQADKCRAVLKSSLVDFYLPGCLDTEHGGYLEVRDDDGAFTGSDKFLTLQARQLWFFSTLALSDIQREESLKAAKSGYKFLNSHFLDETNGGYFALTTRAGEPSDRRKHVYPNAFVIYAFVEYHRASGSAEALEKAKQLFAVLEKHCYDSRFGGYQEFFYDDWRLITDPKESGYVGAINTKTYNSHLHLLEAFTELYEETQDELVGRRLAELIDINTHTVKHPALPCNIDGWKRDWTIIDTPQNLRASYGHDVECAWLVLDAAKALGRSPETLRNWAISICDYSLEHGYDSKAGGFHYTGPLEQASDDRKKVWWTQNEAMVAMLTLHQLTGEQRYREVFDETFEFVLAHQIASKGGWWNTRSENGEAVADKSRTSMWQGAYHNGRSLLLCEALLRASAQSK